MSWAYELNAHTHTKGTGVRFRTEDDMSYVAAAFQGDLKMQKTFSHGEKRECDH